MDTAGLNEDLLRVLLALADEEDDADDEADEEEGACDAADDGACRRARSHRSLLLCNGRTTHRRKKTERERESEGEIFISNSFKCHATACGTLMLLTCNICFFFFMCFAAEVCVRENS